MTTHVSYTRGIGGYTFSTADLTILQQELNGLNSNLELNPAGIGLGWSAYQTILGIIGTRIEGGWIAKPGVSREVFAWISGAVRVNSDDGFAAGFIPGSRGMGRVLIAWELGGNLGHVVALTAVARELREWGHHVMFSLRDLPHADRVAWVSAVLAGEPLATMPNHLEQALSVRCGDNAGLGIPATGKPSSSLLLDCLEELRFHERPSMSEIHRAAKIADRSKRLRAQAAHSDEPKRSRLNRQHLRQKS